MQDLSHKDLAQRLSLTFAQMFPNKLISEHYDEILVEMLRRLEGPPSAEVEIDRLRDAHKADTDRLRGEADDLRARLEASNMELDGRKVSLRALSQTVEAVKEQIEGLKAGVVAEAHLHLEIGILGQQVDVLRSVRDGLRLDLIEERNQTAPVVAFVRHCAQQGETTYHQTDAEFDPNDISSPTIYAELVNSARRALGREMLYGRVQKGSL